MPSSIDAVDDFFRVRLVCILLDTVYARIDRAAGKRKLDNFVLFFQVRPYAAALVGGRGYPHTNSSTY
jgi:hypothetical protein